MDGISPGETKDDGSRRLTKAIGTAVPGHEHNVADVAEDSIRTSADGVSESTSDALLELPL